MRISGAKAIVECLLEQGIDTVFGYPGGRILPLYDALYDGPIRHVRTAHEQGAIHAADGYARASGRVGVCIATSGPGATNLVTGLANAYLDSVPLVVITGQVSTDLIGADAFQEVDTTGITMPVTKHNFLIKSVDELPIVIRSAFQIACSGRPGPVLIDIPSDIQTSMLDFSPAEKASTSSPCQLTEKGELVLAETVALIAASVRPVVIVGGGAISAGMSQSIMCLTEKMGVPVVSTLMGLGAFPAEHPLFLGLTGMHGSKVANHAVHGADVVIAIGSRFSDRVTNNKMKYAAGKIIIHIDVDPAELDKNITSHIGLSGNLEKILPLLCERIKPMELGKWWIKIKQWQETFKVDHNTQVLTAPWMLRQVAKATADKPFIFATDVGQHQMWAAQNLSISKPRTWITSGGLGTMGFGLPAAIGAQIAAPDKRVICVVGDGGIKMTGCELFTVASENLPLITIIVDNSCLGMVRQLQQLFYKQRYSASLAPVKVNFVYFAKAFGIEGHLATTQQEFNEALAAALASDKASVIVVNIALEDLVIPMLVPNAALNTHMDI